MQAIASHPGICALCPLPIVSGELIRRDGDRRWVHVRCDDGERPPQRPGRPEPARQRSRAGVALADPGRRR